MLYVQLWSWATLLKQDKAVAILRGWRDGGKAEAAVECSVGERLGVSPITTSPGPSSRSLQCQRARPLEMGRKGRSLELSRSLPGRDRPSLFLGEILRTIFCGRCHLVHIENRKQASRPGWRAPDCDLRPRDIRSLVLDTRLYNSQPLGGDELSTALCPGSPAAGARRLSRATEGPARPGRHSCCGELHRQ